MTAARVVLERILALPGWVQIFGVIWLLTMITVPILRWTLGAGAERVGISLGVLTQAGFVSALLLFGLPVGRSLLVIILIPALGWGFEFLGSRTGFPFGRYEYTDVLKPQVARVPLAVPAAWLMMIPASAAVGILVAPGASISMQILVAGLAFTAWDLFLDPQMVLWDFWRWERSGWYFGIPISNFLGWFACGTLAVAAFRFLLPAGACFLPVWPLFGVYVATWFFQTTAQLFFWKLVGSAIVGFLGMGAFVAAVFL